MATKAQFPNIEDLCKLLVSCKENGVTELQHGDLRVNFSQSTMAPGPATPELGKVIQEQSEIQKDVLAREEISTREDQIAELIITDPLLAEELMSEGELAKED